MYKILKKKIHHDTLPILVPVPDLANAIPLPIPVPDVTVFFILEYRKFFGSPIFGIPLPIPVPEVAGTGSFGVAKMTTGSCTSTCGFGIYSYQNLQYPVYIRY